MDETPNIPLSIGRDPRMLMYVAAPICIQIDIKSKNAKSQPSLPKELGDDIKTVECTVIHPKNKVNGALLTKETQIKRPRKQPLKPKCQKTISTGVYSLKKSSRHQSYSHRVEFKTDTWGINTQVNQGENSTKF
jgi:hypothetical protein